MSRQDELRAARETLGRLKAGGFSNTVQDATFTLHHVVEKLLTACQQQGEALERQAQQIYKLKCCPSNEG